MKRPKDNYIAIRQEISRIASTRIDELLEHFNISYRWSNERTIIGNCPIHDGDNETAFNMYVYNEPLPCKWICQTKGCHKNDETIIGLVRNLLNKYDGEEHNNSYVIDWLLSFFQIDESKINFEEKNKEYKNKKLANLISDCAEETNTKKKYGPWTRQYVQSQLYIPAKYYLNRNFSSQILKKYDVGVHKKYDRVYIPIFDNDYKHIIAFTSRSIFEKCSKCNFYHNSKEACPSDNKNGQYSKWKNHEFSKKNVLFNYWFAKPYIQKSNTTVLVEGVGDVLRLEENNIHNSVATLGVSISDGQKRLLEKSGVINLIVLFDNDEAGEKIKENLRQHYARDFRLFFPEIRSHDIGDCTKEDIQEIKNILLNIN